MKPLFLVVVLLNSLAGILSKSDFEDYLEKYKKCFGGDQKSSNSSVNVTLNAYISNVVAFNEKKHSLHSTIHVSESWMDPCLKPTDDEIDFMKELISSKDFWVPATRIEEMFDQSYPYVDKETLRVDVKQGLVTRFSLLTTRTTCFWSDGNYPLDYPECPITFFDGYPRQADDTIKEVRYQWQTNDTQDAVNASETTPSKVSLVVVGPPNFLPIEVTRNETVIQSFVGPRHAAVIHIKFQRSVKQLLFKYVFPPSLLGLALWFVPWISREASSTRSILSVSIFMSLVGCFVLFRVEESERCLTLVDLHDLLWASCSFVTFVFIAVANKFHSAALVKGTDSLNWDPDDRGQCCLQTAAVVDWLCRLWLTCCIAITFILCYTHWTAYRSLTITAQVN